MTNHSTHIYMIFKHQFLHCFPASASASISPFDRTDVNTEVSDVVHISTAPNFPCVELVGRVIHFFTIRVTYTVQQGPLAVICLRLLLKSPLAASVMAARQVHQEQPPALARVDYYL